MVSGLGFCLQKPVYAGVESRYSAVGCRTELSGSRTCFEAEASARHGRITYGQLMDFVKTVVLLYTFAA